jgi:hypothetical protein
LGARIKYSKTGGIIRRTQPSMGGTSGAERHRFRREIVLKEKANAFDPGMIFNNGNRSGFTGRRDLP